jgi:hypothetical protein
MQEKVAGELLIPKNITVGSNKPLFVRNAAFYSSPSLILMLLYPQMMSSLLFIEVFGIFQLINDFADQR